MLLRRCERRKSGKRHTYWALVESYRTARGSRQRVVAYLGDLAPSEQDGWVKLCKSTMRHVGHSGRSLIRHLHMIQARKSRRRKDSHWDTRSSPATCMIR